MNKLRPLASGQNAYKFSFDGHLLDEIREIYTSTLSPGLSAPQNAFLHEAIAPLDIAINTPHHKFRLISYGKSPLLWVSCDDRNTYDVFKRFADTLQIYDDVRELVDFKNDIVVYCGYFVVGNRLLKENWHVDYFSGSSAYTFLTPLFELDGTHGNLLYKDKAGCTQQYRYKLNEGIVFGEGFLHSTECYNVSQKMRVLLSFSIGTDKLECWDALKQTIGTQSKFMYLPCGHEKGTCNCIG